MKKDKDEAEKILKQSQSQGNDQNDKNLEKKKPSKKTEAKKPTVKKAKSKSPIKKIKKVSKK